MTPNRVQSIRRSAVAALTLVPALATAAAPGRESPADHELTCGGAIGSSGDDGRCHDTPLPVEPARTQSLPPYVPTPLPVAPLARTEPAAPPRTLRVIAVNSTLTRPLDDGCRYVVRLRGTVRESAPLESEALPAGSRYVPQLSVHAELRCRGEVRDATRRRLPTERFTAAQLVRAVQGAATLTDVNIARVCGHVPRVALKAGRLAVQELRSYCSRPSSLARLEGAPEPPATPPPPPTPDAVPPATPPKAPWR
jgi:hypothetical protein